MKLALWTCAFALATACSAPAAPVPPSAADGTADVALAGDAAADAVADIAAEVSAGAALPSGEFYVNVDVVAFGHLLLPFKAALVTSGSTGGGGSIVSLELRAVSEKSDPPFVSEVIASWSGMPVASGGWFEVVTDNVVLPAKASPTNTDVHIANFSLSGTFRVDGSFCGQVGGTVLEFIKDIQGSTFKAVPWGSQGGAPGASCAETAVKHYAAIPSCPTLQAGLNTITSAERARTFTVLLPTASTEANLPVVFLFHGVNSDMGGILGETGYGDLQKSQKFVLVVPQSERDKAGKAVMQTDWAYGMHAFGDDNPDLVFFDDLRTCVATEWQTDPARVYVTGMSGGGLMSAFVALNRASVIAAAAPSSGGWLFKFPSTANKFPALVTWGGGGDSAYGQNFDLLAGEMISALVGDGHYVIACNHDTGHKWPSAMTAANWLFLSRFRLGESPKPFSGPTLPALFPAYCSVAVK